MDQVWEKESHVPFQIALKISLSSPHGMTVLMALDILTGFPVSCRQVYDFKAPLLGKGHFYEETLMRTDRGGTWPTRNLEIPCLFSRSRSQGSQVKHMSLSPSDLSMWLDAHMPGKGFDPVRACKGGGIPTLHIQGHQRGKNQDGV